MVFPAVALSDLVEVVWVSFIAGVAVIGVFSGAVNAVARSSEYRRAERTVVSGLYLALAAALGAIFTGALVVALRIISS